MIRANLRIWYEKSVIVGWSKFVSVYVKKGKKILEKWIFASSPLRDLFEKLARGF